MKNKKEALQASHFMAAQMAQKWSDEVILGKELVLAP